MTAPELKPCPFCGASASYSVTSDDGQQNEYDTVGCSACPAEMRIILHWADDDGKNKADLLSAWNRRADLAAAQPAHGVWNKCTFDLSGAGYDCAIKDGDARHGAYGEGQKVFWDGTTINADGLYILSKLALDKRIAAAQPAQVRVKPLVWEEDTDPDSDDFRAFVARSPTLHLRYIVRKVYGGFWKLTGCVPFGTPNFITLEAAKAAAQADYEASILAALEPTPDHRDEVIKGLVEAAEALLVQHALENPMRMGNFHSEMCQCRRCGFDRLSAALAAAKAVMK